MVRLRGRHSRILLGGVQIYRDRDNNTQKLEEGSREIKVERDRGKRRLRQ